MSAISGQSIAGPAEPVAPPPRLSRNRDFSLLWSGQAISDMGTQMSAIAYPLLILATTGSAGQAGIVGSATLAGSLLMLLPAGVAADRWPRKRILMITSLMQLIVGVTVVPAVLTHHIYLAHLAGVGFIQGAALAFHTGASQGALRRIVPPEQLPAAYARNQARNRAAVMLGPPAGAALYSVAPFLPFAVDSVSFGAVTGAAALIRTPLDPQRDAAAADPANSRVTAAQSGGTKPAVTKPAADQRLRRRVLAGLRYVFASPYLRMVVIWATVVNGVIAGVRLTAIVLAKQMGATPTEIGLLLSISASCGLVGAIFASRMIRWTGERRLVQLVSCAFPICSAGMAVTPSIWLIGITAGLTGLLIMPINVILLSRAAQMTPDHLQAQMNNAMQLCWSSLAAITPAAFGALTDRIGPRWMIFLTAVAYLAIGIWVITRRSMDLLQRRTVTTADQEEVPA